MAETDPVLRSVADDLAATDRAEFCHFVGHAVAWTLAHLFLVGPGAGRVIVIMEHTDRDGRAEILEECTLPLTGRAVVQRIITNLAVIDVDDGTLILRETAPGVTSDEVQHATATDLVIDIDIDIDID